MIGWKFFLWAWYDVHPSGFPTRSALTTAANAALSGNGCFSIRDALLDPGRDRKCVKDITCPHEVLFSENRPLYRVPAYGNERDR